MTEDVSGPPLKGPYDPDRIRRRVESPMTEPRTAATGPFPGYFSKLPFPESGDVEAAWASGRAIEDPRLSRDNPNARWHQEDTRSRRHGWACIPLTDAVEALVADEAAIRAETFDKGYERGKSEAEARTIGRAEAGGLDVERLARSFAGITGYIPTIDDDPAKWHREWAGKVAAEYARLAEAER